MKSQRFDTRIWMRWGFVLACLFFIVYVSNEVIQVALLHDDQRTMNARANSIESIAVLRGQVPPAEYESAISQFAKKEQIKISLYNEDRKLIFATAGKEKNTLDLMDGMHQSGDSLVYIKKMKSDSEAIGYLKITGLKTVIVGLDLVYFFFVVAGIAVLAYRDHLVRSYSMPIRFAARMAENLLEGSYNMIASDQAKRESILRLNLAMNRISDAMHELNRSYTRQQDSMSTLIENIGNGLLFIDGVGRINYVNQTFKEDFQTSASHWELADYHEVVPYEEVRELIDEAFETKEKLKRQLHLSVHIERKHFDVSCAPVLNKHNKVRGIVVVFHDITAIKKLENTRKDFVANVSHELRTPVTSLIGFAETLIDGARDDKELEDQFLHIMLHEGRRLQSLITDLLELSKIEREHFKLQMSQVSLSNVLDSVLFMLKEKADAKDIHLRHEQGDEGIIMGDSFRIREIMINLISNAISYTPENGDVSVSIHERDQETDFIVADTGMGIEKDQIPRIFERFYRVDKARSRDSGGTGLGLAIVKHLVEAHGGQIHVDSELGKGSTFTITFKKSPYLIG
ncbi:ATP-binding protein [Sporolactobacillus sp. STSJ-5]|uniref:two-component system histidine kinase PnpS n=1 Tax=Sporolactobacillus sp. STSJ-5 TaxID=2965076 RepID=UPI002104B57C|nr:ATP-binding protein [Sporolactobacillus sp. STSJ-5]MCQ2008649.1 ATP-binding protein [Sporolactobacillus sp. STSJ-5]